MDDKISEGEVRSQLHSILGSEVFARSERLSRFLTFVVEHTLAGKADCLKEYVLGAEALGRGVTFDPRTDTSVRVHARRLRSALTEYYAGAGKHEQIIISIPPGGYAPSFHRRQGTVQGVDKPRRKTAATAVAALAIVASFGWWWMQLRSPSTPISSIAVLPFVDLSPETLPEYFCDGLTEEIISALSRTEDLRVVARTSAFQFKGKTTDLRQAGRQLGADAVLEGSVRKAGTRLRITTQLVSVADGYRLWSEVYDREMSDILEVQYEIARDVVAPLNRRIRRKMSSARVAEAHALYLQGLFYWNQWTAGSLLTSVRLYEQAVLKDPDYALAYAGLADSYGALGYLGVLSVKHAQEKKDHVLKTAFRLDPDLPEALTSLAMTKSHYEWDWADAERHLRRALTLQPQSVTAHRHYAIILHCQGRFDEAREQIERAYRLDPLSAQIRATAAYIEQRARHNHQALEWYRRALEIDPNYQRAHLGMAEVYLQDGDFTRAMESLEFACRLARNDAETLGVLGYALGRRGQRHEAIAVARQLTTLGVDRSGTAVALADVHIGLGDNGRALELLEEARNAHDPRMVQLKVNPRYDVLRSQPRFVRLLKSLGFTL